MKKTRQQTEFNREEDIVSIETLIKKRNRVIVAKLIHREPEGQ